MDTALGLNPKLQRDDDNAPLYKSFSQLYETVAKKDDFFDKGPVPWPALGQPNLRQLRIQIEKAKTCAPAHYRKMYFEPMLADLKGLSAKLVVINHPQRDLLYFFMTLLANGATQISANAELSQSVCRLSAVISDIFTPYLHSRTLIAPLGAFVAPHPMFPVRPSPFMLTVDQINQFTRDLSKRFSVGVVGLPSGYIKHPILWGVLAHEVGGHDILHADASFLEDLKQAIHKAFERDRFDFLAPLWSHWCEEAASEVLGVLNIGPSLGISSIIYHTVIEHLAANSRYDSPVLGDIVRYFDLGKGNIANTHPVPAVVPDLIIGAVKSLDRLPKDTRNRWIQQIEGLRTLCTRGRTKVKVLREASIPRFTPGLPDEIPLEILRESAQRIGQVIATTHLSKLGSRFIDIETWDEKDEHLSRAAADRFLYGSPVAEPDFDDAHLLAGALIASLRMPDKYDQISDLLGRSFDSSFARDPVWQIS